MSGSPVSIRQQIAEHIVERFGLERKLVFRRLNIFLTLVPLTEAQLETIFNKVTGVGNTE